MDFDNKNFIMPKDLTKQLSGFQEISQIMEDINNKNREILAADYRIKKEKRDRELKDSQNLERIADSAENIEAKFEYVAKDLDYILSSLGANFQRLENLGREEKDILDQMLLALQYKDQVDWKDRFKKAVGNKSIDVVLNAFFAYIQLKMTGQ